jgi:putative transposase
MPRAYRYFLPGYIWHITHRCHKKEYLLKFIRDRQRWIYWLYQAKKRFKLVVLNYNVTSNHIHLLVYDRGNESVISPSMQLIAGRTGQEYNQRINRKGAFWEDRYHATAISDDFHLAQCMRYIDLNMVRAGVVAHPREWKTSGYYEIQSSVYRRKIVDLKILMELLNLKSINELKTVSNNQINPYLENCGSSHDAKWSQSIAVGNRIFVDEVVNKLGNKIGYRKIIGDAHSSVLREPCSEYYPIFEDKKGHFRPKNSFFWALST